ncbi:hypothetical protein C4F50_14975 [Flavobacterium sp. KB82]|uniref:Uncharacterized protein n=1 Tax=Flavobacterium hungaricum TaxID=2082725 RepID=A0ABR9TLJ1_9FLAO|nr:hypothetical protein [Flavobacterium hungaricum]
MLVIFGCYFYRCENYFTHK